MSFWCLYFLLWTYFTPFSCVSVVDFEQVKVCWEINLSEVNNKTMFLSYSESRIVIRLSISTAYQFTGLHMMGLFALPKN